MDLDNALRWIADFVGLHAWTHRLMVATVIGLSLFVVIFCIERYYGASPRRYCSRTFLHDLAYWFYVRTGLHSVLFSGALFLWVAQYVPQLNVNLIGALPAGLRYIIYFLLMEFAGYWYHRWKHSNRFLWAFHATHHSQTNLTFVTQVRFHFLDDFINVLVVFAPLMVLGAPPQDWPPIYFARLFLEALQHSEIPWRFGPLYRVVVSPVFHAFHHSVRPEHYNRNFGNLLSIWDYIFGTAVDEPERPREYGLPDIQMPTLASQIFLPFKLVLDAYFRKPAGATEAALPAPAEQARVQGSSP